MNVASRRGVARLIAFLVATTAWHSAFSSVVGPPIIPEGASTNTSLSQYTSDSHSSQSGTGNGEILDDGLGHATALYTGNDGSVVAKIKAGGAGADENVQASVTWFFMVVGPPEVALIPLYIQGSGLLSVQGLNSYYNHYEEGVATATFFSSLPGLADVPESLSNNGINRYNLSFGAYAAVYQPYSITLTVSAVAGGVDTAAVEADLDPFVEFQSAADADAYSIVSSLVPPIYGQAPTVSVPEPSTNWIVLAGAIGFWTIRVRRRERASRPNERSKCPA